MKSRRCVASSDEGQATVELAFALPVVVVLGLFVVQVAVLCLSQILVVEAARAAARVAAVDPSYEAVRAAAARTPGLRPARLDVVRGPRGGEGTSVSVTVRYRVRTDVPLVGVLIGDRTLTATATYRVEGEAFAGADRSAKPAALRRERAPDLSKGSFQFPHFGDWTHEGHPSSHSQEARTS